MRWLEIRRHSIRDPRGDGLTEEGAALARTIGLAEGPYARVASSTARRTRDTALEMAGELHSEHHELLPFGGQASVEVNWESPFHEFARVISHGGALNKLADELAALAALHVASVPEGKKGLIICHGGVVEAMTVGLLPGYSLAEWRKWGDPVSYCEGARLVWDQGEFVRGEVLRVSF